MRHVGTRLLGSALLVVLAAAVWTGCEEELPKDFRNRPGGNPLVPEVALLPYPSDFYLVADETTVTGRRLVLPQEALPEAIPTSIFEGMDGFSMSPAILAWLPGGFDLDSLPDPLDHGATLEPDSPVMLVDTATWEPVPALAELDQNTDHVDQQTLIIRPHLKLEPNTGYVVILRDGIRNRAGAPHQANEAFEALRDGKPTADPLIEQQRDSFELVNEAIDRMGLDPGEVVLAWAFHTRSEEQVTSALLEMQRIAWETPAGDWTLDASELDTENLKIDGTFQVPNFLGPGGKIEYDADGSPVLQGSATEEFRLTIPTSVTETRPVIVFGHGFFSNRDESSGGPCNMLCRDHAYSSIASNLGFNEVDGFNQVEVLVTRLEDVDEVVSFHLQKLVNQTALAKLVIDRLSTEYTQDWGGGPFLPFDPDRVHYSGISNGGTFGYTIASTSPAFRRAVLIVGGGGLTHFLQRAVNWNDFAWFFEEFYETPLEMQLMLALLQLNFDPVDSINYVNRLTANRFPGLGPMKVSMHMALNDSQVRNLLTEWVALTAGAPLVTPSPKDIWGLDTLTLPPEGRTDLDSALYVYDEHVDPSPTTNVPPETDNGTHEGVPRQPSLQEHWYQFLENDTYVMSCDGPCDPN